MYRHEVYFTSLFRAFLLLLFQGNTAGTHQCAFDKQPRGGQLRGRLRDNLLRLRVLPHPQDGLSPRGRDQSVQND